MSGVMGVMAALILDDTGEVARQRQQLWQVLRCWEQQHRDVFCLAQADVCADLHKHSKLLTHLPRAPCMPASPGPVSLQSACTW